MPSLCLLSLHALSQKPNALARLILSLPFGQAEQARLRSIKNPAALRQGLGGQLALQALLEQGGFPPCTLICRTEQGKPFFSDSRLPDFSISHSSDLAAALLGDRDGGSVGLDLEFVRPELDYKKIARRFFSEAEQASIASAEEPLEVFYRLWTEKEALAKLCGKGLAACLGADAPTSAYTKSLRAVVGDRTAYLSIACDCPIEKLDVRHYADQKAALLYEIDK